MTSVRDKVKALTNDAVVSGAVLVKIFSIANLFPTLATTLRWFFSDACHGALALLRTRIIDSVCVTATIKDNDASYGGLQLISFPSQIGTITRRLDHGMAFKATGLV